MRTHAADVLLQHSRWMTWNALLALVPFGLAQLLFARPRARTATWWAGLIAFVLFLPNAPYVLTDVIHLFEDIRRVHSDRTVLFILVPVYAGLFTVGFGAYVMCIRQLAGWLRREGASHIRVGAVIVAIHGLSAVGIDLGRFQRFNSWDAFVRPVTLLTGFRELVDHPLRLVVTFTVVTGLYAATRVLTLGVRVWWSEQYANWRHGLT
jgi:uncharacterized membrane protein